MLTKFKIRNFRSIADLTLDFSFGEKRAPNGYQKQARMPFIEDGETRAVPILAMFGPNASGKSNIILAMHYFVKLIRTKKFDVRKVYDPNLIVTGVTNTLLEAEIVKNKRCYTYSIEYSSVGIVSEKLFVDGQILFDINGQKTNFSGLKLDKIYDRNKLEQIYRVECFSANGETIYPLFSILGWDYGGLNASLSSAFQAFTGGVSVFFDDFGPGFLPMAIDMLTKFNGKSQEETLKEVVEVVRKLDVDILSLDIIEHDEEQFEPQKKLYDLVRHENPSGKDYGISIFSKHRNDKGEDVVFRFLERESEGTKRLAVVVAVILHALSVGGIVFFDEFDRSLHPLLVRELLTLFQKELYNPNGAQLCFATHCTDILDDSVLRMSEVGIVGKNIRTGTIIRRLTDMKDGGAEIRNVTNFRKQYLDGFYSGIPYPAL